MKVSKHIQQLRDFLGKLRWRLSGLTRTVSSAKSDVERLDFLIELLKGNHRSTKDPDTAYEYAKIQRMVTMIRDRLLIRINSSSKELKEVEDSIAIETENLAKQMQSKAFTFDPELEIALINPKTAKKLTKHIK